MVTEERNGIYECDFEYPVTGSHFDDITLGRIIGVEHDYTNDVQPFDIVSYSRPIDGVVTFHAVHISYRLRKSVTSASSISALANAFRAFNNATPSLGFSFNTDITGSNYISAFDGVPKSVRTVMGGVEGSILDAYGGEYAFDRFNVTLYRQRGIDRNLTIRYGLNMTDFNEDADYSDSYNACIGYWTGTDSTGNDVVVKTGLVTSGYNSYSGRTEVVALDLTEKFEDKPTVAQLTTEAQNYMTNNQTYLPSQTITVDFINLRDTLEYQHLSQLYDCNLCDTVKVVFPRYDIETRFKVVKTVYDVLLERYQEMELGQLSMTLSEALGLSDASEGTKTPTAFVQKGTEVICPAVLTSSRSKVYITYKLPFTIDVDSTVTINNLQTVMRGIVTGSYPTYVYVGPTASTSSTGRDIVSNGTLASNVSSVAVTVETPDTLLFALTHSNEWVGSSGTLANNQPISVWVTKLDIDIG